MRRSLFAAFLVAGLCAGLVDGFRDIPEAHAALGRVLAQEAAISDKPEPPNYDSVKAQSINLGGLLGAPRLPPVFESTRCISSPQEYAEAFVRGNVNRCVDPDLLVRLETPRDTSRQFSNKSDVFINFRNKVAARPVNFWSYTDNPAKYIRIGRTPLSLGIYTDGPNGMGTGYQQGNFPGIQSKNNYAALLEAIGFSSSVAQPKKLHMMVITRRPRPRLGLGPLSFIPTWNNIVPYYQYYINTAVANAFAPADPYRTFTFDPSTVTFLNNNTYSNLTGCQAECTYEDLAWGQPTPTDWTSATRTGQRTSPSTCSPPTGSQVLNPSTRAQITAPTSLVTDSSCTNTEFVGYYNTLGAVCGNFPTAGGTNATANIICARRMVDLYLAANSTMGKALVFRAYSLYGAGGGFNELFSGDGFTYTGNGGFLGATGNEFLTGLTTFADFSRNLRIVFFCPWNAFTNETNPNSVCGAETYGTCAEAGCGRYEVGA